MDTLDINKLIKELDSEIRQTKSDAQLGISLERLKEIAKTYKGEDRLISSLEILEKIKLSPEQEKYLTGFAKLDDLLKGFRPQQLITLSGVTKHGKTTFAVELTSRLKECYPLWLPFEESAEELVQKFVDRNEEPPLFYTPEQVTGNTMLWIEKKIIESIAKFGTKAVFIDHLHFIVDMGGGENMSLKIGQTMRQLKGLAKKWNVIIFLIAHLKKTKVDTPPELDDLRDSSFVAQEADTVIIIWRETKREDGQLVITNNLNVSVQANRRFGKTGNVKMIYDNGHFKEEEWFNTETILKKQWDNF